MKQRFALLALFQFLTLSRLVSAQLPPRLERCLPYPTLAQEISAMQEETIRREPEAEARPSPKVVIASVQFVPEIHVSQSVRDRIIWSVKSPRYYDNDSAQSWLSEMQEVGVRGALQDSGYFKAKVKAVARLLDGNAWRSRFELTLQIEEGQQYRFGDVRFEPVIDHDPLVFSASELRKHFPIRRGEVFNVSKVREGIEAITRLYRADGYIDMVPTPDTRNDDDGGPIDLVVIIDEGMQYRIGKIELLGLDEKTQNQLRAHLQSGEIYNNNLIDEVLKRYKSVLPADVSSQDVHLTRNIAEHVVDVRFDFYFCPGVKKQDSHGNPN